MRRAWHVGGIGIPETLAVVVLARNSERNESLKRLRRRA
jgi:hypothetical protein